MPLSIKSLIPKEKFCKKSEFFRFSCHSFQSLFNEIISLNVYFMQRPCHFYTILCWSYHNMHSLTDNMCSEELNLMLLQCQGSYLSLPQWEIDGNCSENWHQNIFKVLNSNCLGTYTYHTTDINFLGISTFR